MREILDELLLVSRARQLVIEPSRGQIDEAVDNMRQRLGFESETAFARALATSDMTMTAYRERTARQIKAREVIQREVDPRVTVEDEWLQRYYREHPDEFRVPARARLRELVLPEEKIAGADAMRLAADLRAALAGGEEMAAAVARLGGDRVVGPVDMGWVQPGELAGPLDAAVWSLPPGALSEPVAARGGLHLVEVLERVESTMRPYVDVKGEIEAKEKDRRHDEVMRTYLAELEKKAYLVEQIPPEASGFRETGVAEQADPLAAFAPRRVEVPAATSAPEMERIPEAPRSEPPATPEPPLR
jgi:parvulin-like peptidyl-prolyl isomerase